MCISARLYLGICSGRSWRRSMIAFPVEVFVPRLEVRKSVLEERSRLLRILGALVDAQSGGRVYRRLDDAARLGVRRGVGALGSVPEVYTGKVHAEAGVEDYLGQETVLPLSVEEVGKLFGGAVLVVARVADGDQRRVPRPLVRVQPWPRLGVVAGPVEVQNHLGLLYEESLV